MQEKEEYTFAGQRSDEKVIDVIQQHPYVLYPIGFRAVLLITVGLALIILMPKMTLWMLISGISAIVIAILIFYNTYYAYTETIFLITNERLFYISQKGFFKRIISETDLANIIDIRSETKGFFKTVLHYGDLIIRTAGANEEGDIIVDYIPDPYYAQRKIAEVRGHKDKLLSNKV